MIIDLNCHILNLHVENFAKRLGFCFKIQYDIVSVKVNGKVMFYDDVSDAAFRPKGEKCFWPKNIWGSSSGFNVSGIERKCE